MHPALRPANPTDVPAILALVQQLAHYEQEPDAVQATPELFHQALFPTDGSQPSAYCLLAEAPARTGSSDDGHREDSADIPDAPPPGQIVGMALYYLTFSTWTGKNGIWLEDLFVRPEHRGTGLGKALLEALAEICLERDYPRLEWWVLGWNTPSIDFYTALGSTPMRQWEVHRVDGDALTALAGHGRA